MFILANHIQHKARVAQKDRLITGEGACVVGLIRSPFGGISIQLII